MKFERASAVLDGPRYRKLIRHPWRVLYSKTRRTPTPVSARTFWGDEMTVVLPEVVSATIYRYGILESGLTRALLDLIRPEMIVYDVGAHFGYFSLLATHLGASVHAFEPSPRTFEILCQNVGERAEPVEQAVWNSPGKLEFKDFGIQHSAFDTLLNPKDETLTEPESIYEVETTTIDLYASSQGAVPDLIKIDAEGAELQAVQGASQTIADHKPIITIEVGDFGGDRSRTVIDHALDLGYRLFEASADGLRPHLPKKRYLYDNIVLMP